MTTLLLIRHGESEANRHGIFAGQIDPDLEERGLVQAQLSAKYIAKNYKVDKIYSSDLKRAYRTAECLADILEIEAIPEKRLREIYAGKWEGMHFDDIASEYPDEYNVWMKHIGKAACVGGETVRQLGDRIMKTVTEIAEENTGKTIAIATHATPIRALQSIIQTGGVEEMENISWVSNASVTVIEYENGKWKIKAVSVDDHLEEFRTQLPKNI